ncbi:hypothetical protein [Corynebacterium aurimucosum]|uniref:Putative membrane protein n=1 Tax=Corynebacterium aurimucosum (strain ATCC 700975 / DSM 44827 / CIP 107346 / CN-1) TaxID=548476 RepID=C3PI72_CORA7|nr:hypothetical protein [Corynebacterium aurimucosum]ACP33526.1 putative membrane protein [Corynebacterium aurimucosum ATCC 700975]QQU92364.1 hypothetical protein I6I67_08945 [Corynebacterium aurimucosum]
MLTAIRIIWADFNLLIKLSIVGLFLLALVDCVEAALHPSWESLGDALDTVFFAVAITTINGMLTVSKALFANNRVLRPLAHMGYQVTTSLQETGSINVHTAGDNYIIETIGEES